MDVADLVLRALSLSKKIFIAYRDVSNKRGKCRAMVEQISGLGRLIEEIRPFLPNPLTPEVKTCFEQLNNALENAYSLMEKTSKASILKYVFLNKQVNEDLSSVSEDIEACLRSLPLIQFVQSGAIQKQVEGLRSSFTEISEQLQDQSLYNKEQLHLASEVLVILRSTRNATESQEGILDRLMSWLATHFESDVKTVKEEWEEMKNTICEQAEKSALSKNNVEAELLEQIILCVDELERGKLEAIDHTGIPEEFKCGICLELLQRPVILSSGHTFCKVCIEQTFRKGPATICPNSRAVVSADFIENIGLRDAISRWTQTAPSVAKVPAQLPERTYEPEFVQATILELDSPSSNQITLLKTLNRLLEIGRSADGSVLIYKSGGIKSLAKLLDSSNKKVIEKVVTVLGLLTCPKEGTDRDTEQILDEVFENCLGRLSDLLSKSTGTTRLKAAEALSNLLLIPEVTECLISQVGLISSLAALANDSEACLKGLGRLAKNNDMNLSGRDLQLACLIDLLHSEEDYTIDESLVSLKTALSFETSRGCKLLSSKNAVPSLVRCSIADIDGGVAQEAAVVILEQFVKYEGFSKLVEAGFSQHIAALVQNTENLQVRQAILRLSAGCLNCQQDWSSELSGLQSLIPRLMNVLGTRECTAEVLELLMILCSRNNTCKEIVLDNGGLQVFQDLAESSLSTCRRWALALIKLLLQATSCQEVFARGGGIAKLSNITQMDASVECVTEAVLSLELLTGNVKLKQSTLESLDVDKMISFVDEMFPVQCRKAAASIALSLLAERSSVTMTKHSLKLLANAVQAAEDLIIRKKAGKLLLHATARGLEMDVKMVSLKALLELEDGAGDSYKDLLLSFVARFCSSESVLASGGVPVLLDAFRSKKHQQNAAAAIRRMVTTEASSHDVLLEAGFGRMAVEFLCSFSMNESSCIADVAASLASIYCGRKQELAGFKNVVESFVKLMKDDAEVEVISTAACSLVRFLPLEIEYSALVKRADLIKPLLLVLQSGKSLQALELLVIAAEDSSAPGELYRQEGIPKLIQCLSVENQRVQELATSILLTLGRPNESISGNRLDEIRRSMISNGITAHLLRILQEPREGTHFAVINSACLIRNLNFSGQNNADEKVFTVLHEVLLFYMTSSSVTSSQGYTERLRYIFLALERFSGDRRLKMLMRGSLGTILQALQRDYGENDEAVKKCALTLVLGLVEEASLSKEVANVLLLNSVPALNSIMQHHATSNSCKRLAMALLKNVVKSGPNPQQACRVMRERDCIKVLFSLKQLPGCYKEATEVLELMKKHDKVSKELISVTESNFYPWTRTSSAPALIPLNDQQAKP